MKLRLEVLVPGVRTFQVLYPAPGCLPGRQVGLNPALASLIALLREPNLSPMQAPHQKPATCLAFKTFVRSSLFVRTQKNEHGVRAYTFKKGRA